MARLTLIEFVTSTAKRAAGSRLRVDNASAVSLVDRQKVAVRVVEGQPVAPPPPPPPAPPAAPEPDPVPAEPDDDNDDE